MRRLPKQTPTGAMQINRDINSTGITIIHSERKYELITPLFGGGVEAGVNDDLTPISGKAIRGHLRFWWRATRAGRFGGGDEGLRRMKECEDRIWGSASTAGKPSPSQVQLNVILPRPYHQIGQSHMPYVAKHRPNPDWADRIYAAFPLQETPQSVARYGFTLGISFPETITLVDGDEVLLKKEITAALWAWETFGGLGARTRRGFGALRRTDDPNPLPKDPTTIENLIRARLMEHVVEGEFPLGTPHLTATMSLVVAAAEKMKQVGPNKVMSPVAYNSYDEAWAALITRLRNFRQVRPINSVWDSTKGRNVQRPGRNKWNEPERIREITKQRWPEHTKNADLAAIEAFPRAAFGQPILFQFHRDQKNSSGSADSNRDPIDTTLKGGAIAGSKDKFRERLASPLILRPLACGGTKAVGLAAILITRRLAPERMRLVGHGINEEIDLRITKIDAQKIEPLRSFASRLPNDTDEVDVLEAFIDGFRPTKEKKTK